MSQNFSRRLFVGVRPDAGALRAWEKFQTHAPEWPVRWTTLDLLHITLKFLGETANDAEPKIVSALNGAVKKTAPFSLRLKGGGVFPPKGRPSIFWAGVDGDIASLNALVATVESVCAPFGFPTEERGFHPHVTVTRVPSKNEGAKDLRWLRAAYPDWIAAFESPPFLVENVTLMQSHLSARGARYEERAVIRFSCFL